MDTTKEFSFKATDTEGEATLEAIAGAPRFNEWMYQTIAKNLSGRIMEVGSGIGNISEFFLQDNRRIFLTDIRNNYCEKLQKQLAGHKNLEGVAVVDLVHPDFETAYANLLTSFDSIFALNVVEHIKDDQLAIDNCKKLLRPSGRLLILVPAWQWLYNHFDEALEHYRRYDRQSLSALFSRAGLKVERSQYFNAVGMLGWFVTGRLMKRRVIPGGQMKLYNRLVPIIKIIDRLVMNRVGLSVIVEGVKTN